MRKDPSFDDSTIECQETLKLPAIHLTNSPVNSNVVPMKVAAFHQAIPQWDVLDIDKQTTLILPTVQILEKASEPGLEKSETVGYISLIRNLIKSSGIYALASFASPLVALVLAPFLTHNLSSTDYGALAVLITVISLVCGSTQLGLDSAFFRAYNYDYETEKDRSDVLSTLIILLSMSTFPVVVVLVIVGPACAEFLLKSASFGNAVKLTALVILMQNLTIPSFSWLRAENRPIFFTMLSVVNLLVVLLATVILVGMLHLGINGALIATAGGYATVVFCTLPLMLWRAGLHLRMDITKGLISFGLPNVTSLLAVWVLQLSDRYLLARFGSLGQVGGYNVAYTLGGVLATAIIAPFNLAWPTAMYAIAKKDNAARLFQLVFRWFSCLLLFATYGFSLVSIGLLNFFFPPSYRVSAPIIPIIAMSIMFYGVYIIFLTGGAIRRKTWFAVLFTATSAVVNILLNLVLIPLYGSMGAALSTLLSYMLLAALAYVVIQRIYYIPYQIGQFLIGLLIGIALYCASDLLAQSQEGAIVWVIHVANLYLYGCCLASLVMLPSWLQKAKIGV
jgi:O-antigen/teichoic acid export membrane protein